MDGNSLGAPNLTVLVIADCEPADAGAYACLVSNACGSQVSNAGNLTVNGVGFLQHPMGQCVASGGAVVLSAQATSTAGVFWSWRRNGVAIGNDPPHVTGASTDTLTITDVTSADAGSYTAAAITTSPVVCINESDVAILTVDGCP
jgi:hypothetical protein